MNAAIGCGGGGAINAAIGRGGGGAINAAIGRGAIGAGANGEKNSASSSSSLSTTTRLRLRRWPWGLEAGAGPFTAWRPRTFAGVFFFSRTLTLGLLLTRRLSLRRLVITRPAGGGNNWKSKALSS